jgi:hypothetical protein
MNDGHSNPACSQVFWKEQKYARQKEEVDN